MSGLHLSGSPWFLLLLVPGALILWRQYLRGSPGGGRGVLLLLLQGAALLVLVLSLTGPEWVRRTAVFHNPSVAVLTDRSGSFRGGETLRLGEAYAAAAEAVAERYRPRRFDILAADFHERAWPVAGFPGRREAPPDAGETPLTSLAAVSDFLDSAEARNLQAVFLFSDGRANLDSGLASRTWPVPVYPVVLPVRDLHEAQIERAEWSADGPGQLDVEWMPVGPPSGNPAFQLIQGGKAAHAGELPAGVGEGPRRARVPWKPSPGQGLEGLRAVLEAAGPGSNQDPWNDTVAVSTGAGPRGGKRILVVRPLRSLDEKGMADLLHGLDGYQVAMAAPEEIAARARTGLGGRDQVWIEAGALAGRPDLQRILRETPARVVAYARPGALPAEVAGVKARRQGFSPASEVRPARAAADAFPAGVVRLKSISARGLEVPASEPPWREAAVVAEGGRRGLLMAWFPLAPGKEGLFLALPAMWSLLFDPQADFAVRENLEGLLAAAAVLAERQEGAVKAVVPERVHAGLPFDLEYALPAPRDGGKGGPLEVRAVPLGAPGGGGSGGAWPLSGPGPETFRLEDRSLPAGSWALELVRGGTVLRRDSLVSAPKAALELARIGFDRAALEEIASQSGGRVLAADSAAGVTALLPDLPGAQVKAERTRTWRLHNTRWLFLLAVGLLAAAWLLRKRWDLD